MIAYFKTRCGCTKVMEFITKNPWPEYKIPLACSRAERMSEVTGTELTIDVRTFKLTDYYPISDKAYYEEV
jgi:hypothetical protein